VSLPHCTQPASGRVTVFTDAQGGGPLSVHIGGAFRGELRQYFSVGSASCSDVDGVVSATLPNGRHRLDASDGAGRRWRATIEVKRGACTLVRLAPPGATAATGVVVADSG
jgi:hypothetical protein